MKVTYSPLVTSVSGRFGGMVFSTWQGVDLIRRFVRPAQPRTAAQVDHRDAFRNLLRLFGLLPDVSFTSGTDTYADLWRATWRNFARGIAGQARNFFLGRFLAGASPTLYGRNWFAGSVISVAPTMAIDVTTTGQLSVTVTAGGEAPPGSTLLCVTATAIINGLDLADEALVIPIPLGGSAASGTAIAFTGLTAADVYEVHGAAVYRYNLAPTDVNQLRFSQEAIASATIG